MEALRAALRQRSVGPAYALGRALELFTRLDGVPVAPAAYLDDSRPALTPYQLVGTVNTWIRKPSSGHGRAVHAASFSMRPSRSSARRATPQRRSTNFAPGPA